jgi:hypothetical protein
MNRFMQCMMVRQTCGTCLFRIFTVTAPPPPAPPRRSTPNLQALNYYCPLIDCRIFGSRHVTYNGKKKKVSFFLNCSCFEFLAISWWKKGNMSTARQFAVYNPTPTIIRKKERKTPLHHLSKEPTLLTR